MRARPNSCGRRNRDPPALASAIFRRKAIYEELHPETKAEAFKGNRHTGSLASDNLSFASSTASATGNDKRSIERAAARGEALGDDLGAVTGTSLDKGVELDALALWVEVTKRKPGEGQARDPETGQMLPKLDNIQDREPPAPTGTSAAAPSSSGGLNDWIAGGGGFVSSAEAAPAASPDFNHDGAKAYLETLDKVHSRLRAIDEMTVDPNMRLESHGRLGGILGRTQRGHFSTAGVQGD